MVSSRSPAGGDGGHGALPLDQDRALGVDVGEALHWAVAGDDVVDVEGADHFQGVEPLLDIRGHQPGLAFGEDRVAGEDDAPFVGVGVVLLPVGEQDLAVGVVGGQGFGSVREGSSSG